MSGLGAQGQTHLSSGCCRGFGINVPPLDLQSLISRMGLNLRPRRPTLNANLGQKDPKRHCTIGKKGTTSFSYGLHRLWWWGLTCSPLTSRGRNFSIAVWGLNSYRSRVKQEEEQDTSLCGFCWHVPQTFATQSLHFPKALVSPLTWVGHGKVMPPCGHFLLLQRTNWCFKALHNQRAAGPYIRNTYPRNGPPLCLSSGKESAYTVGDLGSVPGLARSLGKGKGYSLQYPGRENATP